MGTYSDPADLVAQTPAQVQADEIKTWAVSELDKKGKKKKATLGIGKGSIFLASESDKAPVRMWKVDDVQDIEVEKQKQLRISVGGANAAELHLAVNNKTNAEAIVAKLQLSSVLAGEEAVGRTSALTPPPQRAEAASPSKKNGVSVRFTDKSPEIIPPREPSDNEEEEAEADVGFVEEGEVNPELAVALYDFAGVDSDELCVQEGTYLWIIKKEDEEWWKCRNEDGYEGVVPASYLQSMGTASTSEGEGLAANEVAAEEEAVEEEAAEEEAAKEEAARLEAESREREHELELERQRLAEEAQERAEAERLERKKAEAARIERERKNVQAEQRAKAAAAEAQKKRREEEAAAADAERKRQEAARRVQQKSERERSNSPRPASSQSKPSRESTSSSRRSSDISKNPPPPESTRTWHDLTGQFRVEAAFLGYSNGKLRLHKVNGVTIEVPSEKMSQEDMRYVERLMTKKSSGPSSQITPQRTPGEDDDQPLALKRREEAAKKTEQPKRVPQIDWFEFFLSAGCDVDDCTRYASSFEKDKIDEGLLPDITESTMRSLGLREGDIIRVNKAIQQKYRKSKSPASDQITRDEELARKLQEEENAKKPAPNLFAGPGGVLKNNTQRRGRPQPSKSLPPPAVYMDAIGSASEQIKRTESPLVATNSPTVVVERPSSASAASKSGFDDDAWTNRPGAKSSTPAPTPPPAALAPAPPAPVSRPAATPTPPAAPSVSATGSQPQESKGALARTDADIFDQLARLSQLKTNRAVPSPAPASSPVAATAVTSPPASYNNGLGMGVSPVPMAQHLQNQQTGALPPPQHNGPRGPFAPVPVNQGLLQPLVPTMTGYNSFVPTRNASTSPYQGPQFLQSQPTGFPAQSQPLLSQPTGFSAQSQPLVSHPTGFPAQSQPLVSQPTGFPALPSFVAQPTGSPAGSFGTFTPTPPVHNGNMLPISTNPTGLSPFGQPMFTGMVFTPPPPPPLPSSANSSTSPADIFAQMKSGTFATDNDHAASQKSDRYDALRVNPQPTGFVPQTPSWGFHGGYTGY